MQLPPCAYVDLYRTRVKYNERSIAAAGTLPAMNDTAGSEPAGRTLDGEQLLELEARGFTVVPGLIGPELAARARQLGTAWREAQERGLDGLVADAEEEVRRMACCACSCFAGKDLYLLRPPK